MTTRPYLDPVDLDPVHADICKALAAEDARNWGYDHNFEATGDTETEWFASAVLDVVRPGLEAAARARTLHRRNPHYASADDCPHLEPDREDRTQRDACHEWSDDHPWADDGENGGHVCLAMPTADHCPTCRDKNGDPVAWPCATAIVLGLAPLPPTAGEWNAAYPTGAPVTAWPNGLDGEAVATHTSSAAIPRELTHDGVYVEHARGEIALSHVQPRPDCDCCVCAARTTDTPTETR